MTRVNIILIINSAIELKNRNIDVFVMRNHNKEGKHIHLKTNKIKNIHTKQVQRHTHTHYSVYIYIYY